MQPPLQPLKGFVSSCCPRGIEVREIRQSGFRDHHLGAAFGYTDSDSDFTVGSLDTDAYTLALYGSAFFDCGYVDVIGRVGRLSSDIDMTRNFTASYDNTTFGLSAEVGY